MTLRPLILAFLVGFPSLALAQAEMPAAQDDALSALAACATGLGSLPAMDTALTGFGWEKTELEGEVEYANPKNPDDVYATISDDGMTCSVWSDTIKIDDAKTMTQATLEQMGEGAAVASMFDDEYGCQALKLASGVTVQAISTDETPQCDSEAGSIIILSK